MCEIILIYLIVKEMNKIFIFSIGVSCLLLNLISCNDDLPTSDMQMDCQSQLETKSLVASNDTILKDCK